MLLTYLLTYGIVIMTCVIVESCAWCST